MSPTQRTLAHLKRLGIPAQVVEKWNQYARVRVDLFGVIDVLALTQLGIVGIQVTSGSCVSARLKKIQAEPLAVKWLQAGAKLVVHGWAKRGPRGKRKLWHCRVVSACLDGGEIKFVETSNG